MTCFYVNDRGEEKLCLLDNIFITTDINKLDFHNLGIHFEIIN